MLSLSSTQARRAVMAALVAAFVFAVPSVAFAVSRDAVLARAEKWVVKNVPYSQSRYAKVDGTLIPVGTPSPSLYGYRTDCSGFGSMSLALAYSSGRPISLDSASLPTRCTEITADTVSLQKAKLRPGDLMIKPKTRTYSGHVVVFVRWVDAARTRYVGYHESGSAVGTVASEIPYPYWNNDTRFRPFRYTAIESTTLRRSRTWYGPLKPTAPIGTRLYALDPAARTGFFLVP
jgi:hypothetical protein